MKLRIVPLLLVVVALCGALGFSPNSATAANYMIQADVNGQRVEGRPIYWGNDTAQLILRDGQFYEFQASAARNFRRSSEHFRPYSANELRARLTTEFGRDFDVTATAHYVVVHPKGQKDRWASRFEDLYRSFVHYFKLRDLKLTEPEYPLVAIVWPNQQAYQKYAASQGVVLDPKVIGYYSQASNRVHLFDATTSGGGNANWQQNATVIIHEVTHQTAFNTNVHNRFSGCPRWLAEGLGTLFEARGVHSCLQYQNRSDRINRGRLAEYHHFFPKGVDAKFLSDMIASDALFDRDMSKGYAAAWAFTFFLVETQPRHYADLLALTAARKSGGTYPQQQRLADFTKIFGNNLPMIASTFTRYMNEVK